MPPLINYYIIIIYYYYINIYYNTYDTDRKKIEGVFPD
jgi:hypothetical protein